MALTDALGALACTAETTPEENVASTSQAMITGLPTGSRVFENGEGRCLQVLDDQVTVGMGSCHPEGGGNSPVVPEDKRFYVVRTSTYGFNLKRGSSCVEIDRWETGGGLRLAPCNGSEWHQFFIATVPASVSGGLTLRG